MECKKLTFLKAFEFIKNGASIKQDEQAFGIPITRIETIADGTINNERFGYANIFDTSAFKNYLMAPGDILMSHINSVKHLGKSALYQGEPDILIHGMNLLCLRPNVKSLDPEYAISFLKSRAFLSQILKITKNSVNQASFSVTSLKELEIPLPDLPTQQHIAAVLDKADALRQQNRQLLTYYDQLLQSTFIELFGDPVTNEKGWEVRKLGEVITNIDSGWSPVCLDHSRENENEWAVLKLGSVTYRVFNPDENKKLPPELIGKEEIEVKAGDLLFSRKNTRQLVGATVYVESTPKKLLMPDTIFRLIYTSYQGLFIKNYFV